MILTGGVFYLFGLLKMQDFTPAEKGLFELSQGMDLDKCRKCGCMQMVLETLESSNKSLKTPALGDLLENINHWMGKMDSIIYDCLECDYCYPAEAMKIFNQSF
jgi:hypothetical protein